MDYKEIGKRIRQVRVSHGLKQDEFAEKIGCNRHSMSRIECGIQPPPFGILGTLWTIFKVDSNWILNGVELKSDTLERKRLEEKLKETNQTLADVRAHRDSLAHVIELMQKIAGVKPKE